MAFPFVFSGFLAGMQAAGLVMDYSSTKSKQKIIRKGRELEDAQYQNNLEILRMESQQASLKEMQDLRTAIGTQIVSASVRGVGSFGAVNKSLNSFSADERTRRLNLLAKEANLRSANVLSGLHTLESETQLGQQFTSKALNTLPASSLISSLGKTELGKKWGFGLEEKA
jgi:hypothetical protein